MTARTAAAGGRRPRPRATIGPMPARPAALAALSAALGLAACAPAGPTPPAGAGLGGTAVAVEAGAADRPIVAGDPTTAAVTTTARAATAAVVDDGVDDGRDAEPVADTAFSVDRGLYDAPFDIVVDSDTAGARIGYTLDGSDPRGSRTAVAGAAPLTVRIDPAAAGVGGAGAVVLRAYAFADGRAPTNVDTQTYVFPAAVARQPAVLGDGWPTYRYDGPGGPADHDYAMDPRIAADPALRDDLVAGLAAIPTLSLALERDAFWRVYRGLDDDEAAVSVEVIDPADGGGGDQADGWLEAHSHDRVKRSLRLAFKGSRGDGALETALLRRAPLGGAGAADRLDRVVLRAGNNRSWARTWNPDRTAYTEDQWIRDSQIALSGYGSRGAFVHLYVNGIYWGLYNAVERPGTHWAAAYGGGDDDDWTAVNHDGPADGDPARWDALVGAAARAGLADGTADAALDTALDVDAFIDYLLLMWTAGVRDWPENNWWAVARQSPPGPFRLLAWDGEWSFGVGFGSPERAGVHPAFAAAVDAAAADVHPLARLFHAARRSPAFRARFAARAAAHLGDGGALAPDAARGRWRALNAPLRNAIVAESARWGDATDAARPRTRADWQREVDAIDAYLATAARDLAAALAADGLLDRP